MLSIVIPTYNEAENVMKLIPKIHSELKGIKYQVIISDDNSPDGTGRIAIALSKKYPVKVINRTKNRGYGESCKDGFKLAFKDSDYIATMDCDLSHNPEAIPRMLAKAKQGFDIVVGSRYIKEGGTENWGLHRKIMSRGANIFTRHLLGIPVNDCTSGFRLYKKEVLKKINLDKIHSNGYSFLEELLFMLYKRGFNIGEVPIIFKERVKGKSKLSKKEMFKFILTTLRLRFL